jgi:hypothetical protein
MLDRQINNLPLLVKTCRSHHEDLIRKTEHGQLLDKSKSDRLPPIDHVLMVIGGILIAIGEKLQERCILVMPNRTRAHSTKY